ncbi:helix-turn-helix domain-containing protein [Duganella sp. CF458]|uniref:helix-turn-helix domain-containing protein n=1 Tax=Duganella sp. CF458 TaxID=1884368 RepID=UPI000B81C858|nr:helix-turn-helix domain-containing protein [Duganella sp. CF458]
MGTFRHERLAPCAQLAGLVEHYWFVGWDMHGHPPQQQETLPHPNVHLVIEHDSDGVYGVHTARYTKLLAGQGFAFGIKFRPGGFRPFLGRAVAEIADQRVALAQVFGSDGNALARQVRACAPASAPHAMAAAAQAFLLARLPLPDADTGRAAALVAAIAADPALLTVDALAAQAGSNKRALQRLFQQYVGVGPKWVIKRYRMHEAVAQLQAGAAVELAQLALRLGYYDQAHFIKEFTALVGKPPGAYLRHLRPPATR